MFQRGLPAVILGMSLLYIFVIPSEPLAVKLLFKLIPMVLILLYARRVQHGRPGRYSLLMMAGLFFCMMGDGLLVWFVVGLTAFLIGHLFYTAAFLTRWRFTFLRLASVIPIVLFGLYMGHELRQALLLSGQTELIIPVLVYISVISLMGCSAVMTGSVWAIAGSVLFIVSDSILSWNMFIEGVSHSGIWIMSTYYTAQFLMARSIGAQHAEL
ncbi:lysoplasmalogenase [Paenibacillus sp. FJAT-26967]|uniref:lysoplasmalogenase n=1 Tax=Paenibacillus sp. FJAT-26967 TaxID=1729690 RepID=UPI000A44FEE4|nr:lysoplasmalogenase [Paenibacillus sp. FJAT-26967]